MSDDLAAYMERITLMTFFCGYPLLYALVFFIAGKYEEKKTFARKLTSLLPLGYALSATLFLGLFLKNISVNYSLTNAAAPLSFLQLWGLSAVLFWIPALSKKPVFSLLHSAIFLYLLLKDLFIYTISSTDKDMVRNDMKIYTLSLLINTGTFIVIALVSFILSTTRKNKKASGD